MRSQTAESPDTPGGSDDYLDSLLDKLVGQAQELLNAPADGRLLELADVHEVLRYLVPATGHTLDDVIAAADHKRAKRRAFDNRIWLEHW